MPAIQATSEVEKKPLTQDVIMDALRKARAIFDDAGPGDPVNWTKRNVEDFMNNLFPNIPDGVTEAQVRRCDCAQELFTLLIKNPDGTPGRENQTLNPVTLKLNSLKILPDTLIEVDCKCDGVRNIADEFNVNALPAHLATPFSDALERVTNLALTEVTHFSKLDNLELVQIRPTTIGTGKNKKDIIEFIAADPDGADGNKISSGKIQIASLSPSLQAALEALEAALLEIYKRPVRVVETGQQQLLPVGKGSGPGREEDDAEEPIDD